MALRQDDSTRLGNKATPDIFKSESEVNKERGQGALDTVASYLPGQHKSTDAVSSDKRDHEYGRSSAGDQARAAVQPEGNKTMMQSVGDGIDSAVSALTPESNKTSTQRAADTVNPSKHGEFSDVHHHHAAHGDANATGEMTHTTAPGEKPTVLQTLKDAAHDILHPGSHNV